MRAALVGDTMPPAQLVGAMSIQRTTQDSAQIAGALTGAGLVAMLGMGPAYVVVASLYATSVLLTLQAGSVRARAQASRGSPASRAPSPWRDLKEGLAYVLEDAAPARGDVPRVPAQPDGVPAASTGCCRTWRRRSTSPTRPGSATWSRARFGALARRRSC